MLLNINQKIIPKLSQSGSSNFAFNMRGILNLRFMQVNETSIIYKLLLSIFAKKLRNITAVSLDDYSN
jgi:hypothetical protein